MEISSHKIRNFFIFREITCKVLKNKQKKSALKKVLVSYDVFAIFTAVKHRKILCKAKIQQRYNVINN